jgi:hypothetical protein
MARLNTLTGSPKTKLKLDWKEYFRKFVEEHGEPVEWQDRLLFRDGWQYSNTRYQGPEVPPLVDGDKLKTLKIAYWKLLHERLSLEVRGLAGQIAMLTEWQNERSMPLQQRVSYLGTTEEGLPVRKRGDPEDLNLSGLNANLADRQYFKKEAQEMLDELTGEVEE